MLDGALGKVDLDKIDLDKAADVLDKAGDVGKGYFSDQRQSLAD